jgi:hypothetical protein
VVSVLCLFCFLFKSFLLYHSNLFDAFSFSYYRFTNKPVEVDCSMMVAGGNKDNRDDDDDDG